MKKRLISMVLSICMLISVIMPVTPIAHAVTNTLEILHDGAPLSQLVLPSDEKETLTASFSCGEGAQYQWQLLLSPGTGVWVDIYDKTEAQCEVSYALVKNLLDASGSTGIRCKVTQNGESVYSAPVGISIVFAEKAPTETEPEMVLLTDLYVLEPEEEIPGAAEPTEEASEPTEESSEPTEESSEPTEESSEPTEESSAPTEESSEPTEESSAPTEESSEPTEETSDITLMADLLSLFALPVSAEETEQEYVTVTIKYLDVSSLEEGAEEHAVYSPYTATIEKGSDFNQTVISPTYLGFAPYWDGQIHTADAVAADAVTLDASSIKLNLTAVSENVVLYVYYKPIAVNFTVRYYFQNINDDLYTEDSSLYHTGKATTGSIISDEDLIGYAEAKKATALDGFSMMYHIPEAVAADGSTVFECYLDRNYYLIMFDLNGGYSVDPIYARYGTPIVFNDPVKHGYQFAGWDLLTSDSNGDGTPDTGNGVADPVPSSVPNGGQYYRALWKEIDTTYTVVYWQENADDDHYSYWGSVTQDATSGTYVSGSDDVPSSVSASSDGSNVEEKDYFTYNGALTDKNILVAGDGSTVVNVYYDRKEYKLRFYYARYTGSAYQIATNTNGSSAQNGTVQNASWNGSYTSAPALNDSFTAAAANGYAVSGSEVIGSYTYYYIDVTAKYLADLNGIWPAAWIGDQGTQKFVSWGTQYGSGYHTNNSNKNIKGTYRKLDNKIIIDPNATAADGINHILVAYWSGNPTTYQYNIYYDLLPGVTDNITVYDGISYQFEKTDTMFSTDGVSGQSPLSFEGVTIKAGPVDANTGSGTTESPKQVNFYYTRNVYNLVFHNYGTEMTDQSERVQYDAPLIGYRISAEDMETNHYPDGLEPDAYTFGGWYMTPGCFDGTEAVWDSLTMPSGNLSLYAKWVPKTHTVRFFTSYDRMRAYEGGDTSVEVFETFGAVAHGNVVGSIENPPVEEGSELVFGGWYYMENGVKKAFSPTNMPINRDMHIFADWTSESAQPYRIEYRLFSDKTTKVADNTEGKAYYGSTRTFSAKAGSFYNQLYSQYNSSYYPVVASHSITIDYETPDATPETAVNNVYTFYYVQATELSYTVRHVNAETGLVMDEEAGKNTTESVVTERFKTYEGMVPDAFYKRLVLAVEVDEDGNVTSSPDNVITFYYTPNETSAYYAVHFMLEKPNATEEEKQNFAIDGSGGYEETGVTFEGTGTIGDTIPVNPQSFPGFALLSDKAKEIQWNDPVEGQEQTYTASTESLTEDSRYEITVTKNGTELYIFYERLEYPYAVHYYKYNTTDSLTNSKLGASIAYGGSVTETAIPIEGYTCVSAASQTITIREETDTDQDGQVEYGEITQNVIIFYYAETQYTVEYVSVPADGGQLSRTIEVTTGAEAFNGSTATANQFYTFAGWYLDEACTQPVSGSEKATLSADGTTLLPVKSQLNANGRNIFYAKFDTCAGDLTITRTDALESDQVFVYKVENQETGEAIYVTVTGNGSVTIHDLLFGHYTVTQQNGWSWRYSDGAQNITHEGSTTVQFKTAATAKLWLNGNSPLVKNRKKED